MRLIDADELKERVEDITWFHINDKAGMVEGSTSEHISFYRCDEVIDVIDKAPTIDAVPVVRCEECKWGKFHTHIPPWTHWCVRDPKEAPSKQAKDFCSYGEKAGDAE